MSTAIPNAESMNVQTSGDSWRFSQGAVVRGQEIVDDRGRETGRYPEEKTRVVGILRRVGIYNNPNSKYGKKLKLEADIETSDGMMHIGVNLLKPSGELKPTISAVGFAWCLLQFAKDELMMIETKLGEAVQLEDGTKGGKPTYVNAYRVDGSTATPIYRPKRDPNAPRQTMIEQWTDLEAQLRAHEAYAEREVRNDDDDDGTADTPTFGPGYKAMMNLCSEKRWPHLQQAPAEWLKTFGLVTKTEPKASVDEWGDDDLKKFADALSKVNYTDVKPAPGPITEWLKANDKWDPFADKDETPAIDVADV